MTSDGTSSFDIEATLKTKRRAIVDILTDNHQERTITHSSINPSKTSIKPSQLLRSKRSNIKFKPMGSKPLPMKACPIISHPSSPLYLYVILTFNILQLMFYLLVYHELHLLHFYFFHQEQLNHQWVEVSLSSFQCLLIVLTVLSLGSIQLTESSGNS